MEKHLRKSRRNREHNDERKGAIKAAMQDFEEALDSGDEDTIREAYSVAQKALDKAARDNVIPENRASRRKSWMARQMNEAGVVLG